MTSQLTTLPPLKTVTGANRGIGLGVAESCLDNGASVVYSIDYAAPEPGDDFAAAQARWPGDRLRSLRADVTREATVTEAVARIVEECGALHGMVVNAGRTNHKAALDFTEEEIHELFNINVSGLSPSLPFPPSLPLCLSPFSDHASSPDLLGEGGKGEVWCVV